MSVKPILGVGMLGYGFIGKVHSLAYQVLPMIYDPAPARIKLVGAATASQKSAAKAVDQAGYEFGTTDWRELIARDDIDIVNCCTPNYLHRDMLLVALQAGKHVYCDKPLAMNLAEAREIVAAAEASGKQHQMNFQCRYIPAILRAKQLVEDGFLGEVFSFRAAYLHAGYIDPGRPMSWRLDASQGGAGALFDLGAHVVDLIRYLLGDFASVLAVTETFIPERPVAKGATQKTPVNVDDMALVTARLAGGAIGTIEASRLATGTNDELRLEIHGQKGALRFNLMDPNWLYVYDTRDAETPIGGERGFKAIETVQRYPAPAVLPGPKFAIGWIRYHVASQFAFVSALVEGRPTSPNLVDGLKAQEVLEACSLSARQGKWVDLPLPQAA